jgi:hypothetical protein
LCWSVVVHTLCHVSFIIIIILHWPISFFRLRTFLLLPHPPRLWW